MLHRCRVSQRAPSSTKAIGRNAIGLLSKASGTDTGAHPHARQHPAFPHRKPERHRAPAAHGSAAGSAPCRHRHRHQDGRRGTSAAAPPCRAAKREGGLKKAGSATPLPRPPVPREPRFLGDVIGALVAPSSGTDSRSGAPRCHGRTDA